LRFDVSAQTYATFREAAAVIRRRSTEPMNDDALLLQVAREVLQGPSEAGRSSYQVSVTVCERCQRGVQHGAGADVELPPEVVAMLACDSQLTGSVATNAPVAEEFDDSTDHDGLLADADSGSVPERKPSRNKDAGDSHELVLVRADAEELGKASADSRSPHTDEPSVEWQPRTNERQPPHRPPLISRIAIADSTGSDHDPQPTQVERRDAHTASEPSVVATPSQKPRRAAVRRQPTHELQATHVEHLDAHTESEPSVVTTCPPKPTQPGQPSTRRQPTRDRPPTQVERRSRPASPSAIAATMRPPRATQTIPPAVRRHVLHRDRGRCVVPGCTHGTYLDVHHLCARAEGGTHEPDNLVTLCAGHHTALHAGQLSIEGRPSTTLRFLRADGTRYTEAPSARAVAVGKQVVGALRGLGFSERDSRTAVARVLEAAETRCSAALLRAALAVLGASLS